MPHKQHFKHSQITMSMLMPLPPPPLSAMLKPH
jgi:hypothetical protein